MWAWKVRSAIRMNSLEKTSDEWLKLSVDIDTKEYLPSFELSL
jgi:hypothetical protein